MASAAHISERATRPFSEATENYVKEIYTLRQRDPNQAVTTNDLAARLGVTPASASSMVKKLATLDLATHKRYYGVELTDAGEQLALEMLRHHRLLELYLVEHLNVPWDRVHAEAEVLEHVLSEDLEARIAEKLGNPTHDPHGDPIPTADLKLEERTTQTLSECEIGSRGVLVRVSDSDPEMLRYLQAQSIGIGDSFEVLAQQPFGGPLTVRFEKTEHSLGLSLATAMRVELNLS